MGFGEQDAKDVSWSLLEEGGTLMDIATVGIDLAENIFQLLRVDARGSTALSKSPIADVLFSFNGSVALILMTPSNPGYLSSCFLSSARMLSMILC